MTAPPFQVAGRLANTTPMTSRRKPPSPDMNVRSGSSFKRCRSRRHESVRVLAAYTPPTELLRGAAGTEAWTRWQRPCLPAVEPSGRSIPMHELSIALSLVDAVCEQLPRLGEQARVRAVHVRIGTLSGVVPEALAFSFDVAAAGSPIEGARLKIRSVAIQAWCEACGDERQIAGPSLHCPVCDAPTPRILAGRELELTAVEVIDDHADPRSPAEHPQEE